MVEREVYRFFSGAYPIDGASMPSEYSVIVNMVCLGNNNETSEFFDDEEIMCDYENFKLFEGYLTLNT